MPHDYKNSPNYSGEVAQPKNLRDEFAMAALTGIISGETFSAIFSAAHAAQAFLSARGFSYGPSQRDGPQGILFGEFIIAKWRNLTAKERAQVHGTIAGNGRHGPITVTLKSTAPDAARAAFLSEVQS
jgi:hypothetical protein